MKRLLLLLVVSLCAPAWAVVNVNTASQAELEQLPGIGPGRAQAIVEHRTANGPFRTLEDLGRVKGIGAKTLAELKQEVSFDLPAATPAPPPVPPAAAAGGSGIPWLLVAVAVLLAGLAALWLVVKRRTAPVTAPPATRSGAAKPASPAPAARPAAVAASPAAAPTSAPPRPAGAAGPGDSPTPSAPAGAPPRPAGSRPEPH